MFLRLAICQFGQNEAPGHNGMRTLIVIFTLIASSDLATAGDWPQILGIHRNGIAETETLADWNVSPKIGWQIECGTGFAGVSVVANKLYLAHRIGAKEVLDCLAADTGEKIWRAQFPASYAGGYNPDDGPRCVPIVDRDQVIVHGAAHDVHAVDITNGKVLWTRALGEDYITEDGYFGAGSTPVVIGDSIVIALGGEEGAGVVALSRDNGKTQWALSDLEADYASPVAFDKSRVIVPMRMTTLVIDASAGKILHEIPFGKRGLNVIGATPVLAGKNLLLTASYGIGAQLIDLSNGSPEVIWDKSDVLSSQYNSGVVRGEYIYGTHGREDMGRAAFRCVNLKSSEVQWTRESYGVAHVIRADNRLLLLNSEGQLEMIAADSDSFKSLGKFDLPNGTYRAVPALSNGRIFCRSSDRGAGKLVAVELP